MYNGTMKRGKIMTRDKAIEEVKNYENYPNGLSKECRDYIVKALEQVPSSSENPTSSTPENDLVIDTFTHEIEMKIEYELLKRIREARSQVMSQEPTTKNNLAVDDEERELALMYLEQIKEDYIEGVGYERHPLPEYYAIKTAIKSLALPSVTPIRPKGRWIEERNDYGKIEHWHCSNCYDDSGFITTCKWDYCPSCGSDNREVEE